MQPGRRPLPGSEQSVQLWQRATADQGQRALASGRDIRQKLQQFRVNSDGIGCRAELEQRTVDIEKKAGAAGAQQVAGIVYSHEQTSLGSDAGPSSY